MAALGMIGEKIGMAMGHEGLQHGAAHVGMHAAKEAPEIYKERQEHKREGSESISELASGQHPNVGNKVSR